MRRCSPSYTASRLNPLVWPHRNMRENNAANSGNAEKCAFRCIGRKCLNSCTANPELGPSGLSVETLHGTPRTGEEKVRTDGNKNRQRRVEMTRPLDRWSVQLEPLQL